MCNRCSFLLSFNSNSTVIRNFYTNMMTSPLTVPTPTTIFSGKTVSSPPRHVRFQPTSYMSVHRTGSCTTPYQILGINAAASDVEVKAAYRRLAKLCHPDKAAADRKESSACEFMKIHAAYRTLSDPVKRASYDKSLLPQPLTIASSSLEFSRYKSRNWETDQCW